MHARLVERPLQHLSSPARLGPGRQVHELPHLREYDVRRLRGVSQCAEDGHLAELVVQRDAAAGDRRGRDDAIRLFEARHERFFAEHMRADGETSQRIVAVCVRWRANDDHVGLALTEHGVEIIERRHLEPRGRALALLRVGIARSNDDCIRNARQRWQVQCESGISQSHQRDTIPGHEESTPGEMTERDLAVRPPGRVLRGAARSTA